jgi:hypothetical protein
LNDEQAIKKSRELFESRKAQSEIKIMDVGGVKLTQRRFKRGRTSMCTAGEFAAFSSEVE